MACLDTTTKSLTIELSSSPTAQADWTVHYGRKSAEGFAEVNAHGATSNTAQVTMVSPPAEGEVLSIRDITVFNNDNSAITFKIRLFDGLASRVLYAQTLGSQEAWSSLAQKGRDGEAGATGTVNAASGLLLDESSAPNTIYNQGAIYVNNNELFFRRENNAQPFLISGQREVLTADRTYYVRTDGNDSNNGLSNTSGGAFLTIQKAFNTACTLDCNIYTVTIKVADGTYDVGNELITGVPLSGVSPFPFILEGNITTPANVVLTGTSRILVAQCGINVTGINFGTTLYAQVQCGGQGYVNVYNCVFSGTASMGIYCLSFGQAVITGDLTISASYTNAFVITKEQGYIRVISGITFTFSGTPNLGIFCNAFLASIINFDSTATFSGATTGGTKYSVSGLSLINSGGNTFPGVAAGTTATGGQYI